MKEIDVDGKEGEVRERVKLVGDAVANNVLTSTTQVSTRLFASFDMEAPISSNSSPTSLEIDFHTNLSTDAAFPSPQRCCDECERKFHEIEWENIDNDCKFFVSVISRTILPSCPVCQGGLFSGYSLHPVQGPSSFKSPNICAMGRDKYRATTTKPFNYINCLLV